MVQYNPLSKETITKVALQSGLELKQLDDGTMGLRPYIFTFADNLFKEASKESDSDVVYYPATLHPCAEEGGYGVTFRDVPEANTQGSSFAEAIEYAEDALETCKEFYIDRPYPKPSSPLSGDVMVGVKLAAETETVDCDLCSCGYDHSKSKTQTQIPMEDVPTYLRNLDQWDTSKASDLSNAFTNFTDTESKRAKS